MSIFTALTITWIKFKYRKSTCISSRRRRICLTCDSAAICTSFKPESLRKIIGKGICSSLHFSAQPIACCLITLSLFKKLSVFYHSVKANHFRQIKRNLKAIQMIFIIYHIILHQLSINRLGIPLQLRSVAICIVTKRKERNTVSRRICCNSTSLNFSILFRCNYRIFIH